MTRAGWYNRLVFLAIGMICTMLSIKTFPFHSMMLTCKKSVRLHSISTTSRLYFSSVELVNPIDGELYEELRQWRRRTSEELQRPPYTIFSNKVLEDIVAKKPTCIEEFVEIKGVGPKTQRYGEYIFEIIQKYPSPKIDFENDIIDSKIWETNPTAEGTIKKKKIKEATEAKLQMRKTLKPPPIIHKIPIDTLTEEQADAAIKALRGNNIFISGSAGTGKSYLLAYVIQELKERHGDDAVAVTSPTGVAAINIGGQTIHAFSGIGLGNAPKDRLVNKVLLTANSYDRWKRTKVLVIDEISMLGRDLFELLDEIARAVKKNHLPFGGIQIIAVGDFFQLPPVQSGLDRKFCFQSDLWEASGFRTMSGKVFLRNIVRQNDDQFIDLLNAVRIGKLNKEQYYLLDSCVVGRKSKPMDDIIPTKLYCINKDVDKENAEQLNHLHGELVVMEAIDDFIRVPTSGKRGLLDLAEKTIPKSISLKIGAQVMLLRNRNRAVDDGPAGDKEKAMGLVNGSRGVITGFVKSAVGEGVVPMVRFDNKKTITVGRVDYVISSSDNDMMIRKQVPLRLAWASTVHKSQGTTLTRAELMLTNSFDYGQAYVALSRVTQLSGLWLTNPITSKSIKVNPLVLQNFPEG